MSRMSRYGKIRNNLLESVIRPRLGSRNRLRDLLVGPGVGLDNAVISMGGGKVLVGKTDPLSWIPMLGARDSAWLSIHQIASDFLTSGVAPQYAFFDFNLPPTTTNNEFQSYWDSIDREMKSLDITVAGGHTGRYEGCNFTVIGGATLFGVGSEKEYLAPNMANVGDSIVVTKGAAVECTAILAKSFPKRVSRKLGASTLERSVKYFPLISAAKDARVAMSKVGKADKYGGITSMHDAEEGGILSAICEVALASDLGFSISRSEIPISEESREICKLFGIHDPYAAIGGGSLVLTASPESAQKLVKVFTDNRIRAAVVGSMEHKAKGFKIIDEPRRIVRYPMSDPYWKSYTRASKAGWN